MPDAVFIVRHHARLGDGEGDLVLPMPPVRRSRTKRSRESRVTSLPPHRCGQSCAVTGERQIVRRREAAGAPKWRRNVSSRRTGATKL